MIVVSARRPPPTGWDARSPGTLRNVATGARILAARTGWLFGAGALAQLLQLGYGTLTSRMLTAADFGAYSIALTVLSGIGLFASAGMDEAVARLPEFDRREVRQLAGWAVTFGVLVGGGTALSAPLWGRLFADPQSVDVIRLLAVGTALAPYAALLAGLTRAQGRFRQYAILASITNVIGLAVGLVAVHLWGTPVTLAVAALASGVLTVLGHRWYVGFWVGPSWATRESLPHIRFGAKVTSTHSVEYFGLVSSQLALARGPGSAILGQWNRAAVFGSIPVESLTGPAAKVLYPELGEGWERRDGQSWLLGVTRGATAVGLLGGAAWGAFMTAGLPWLIGPQWHLAGLLAAPLALTGGMNLASMPMTNALMAGGEFREFLRYQPITTAVYLIGAAGTLVSHSPWFVALAYPLAGMTRLLMAGQSCRRVGLLPASGAIIGARTLVLAAVLAITVGLLARWGFAPGAAAGQLVAALVCIVACVGGVTGLLLRTPTGSALRAALRG